MFRTFVVTAILITSLAASAVAQDEEGITLNVRTTPLGQVLEMISVQQRVNIVAGVDTSAPVTANFYDASLEESLDWVLTPLGFGWTFDGKVYTVMSIDDLEIIEEPVMHQIFRPNYRSARELESFLVPMLSPQGRIIVSEQPLVGIESSGTDAGGDNSTIEETLLIIDTERSINKMTRMVADFDMAPRQVLVEATILEVFLDETNKFGVDFDLLLNSKSFGDFESLTAPTQVYSDPATFLESGLGTGATAAGAPFLTPTGTSALHQSGFTFPLSDDGMRLGYVGTNFSLFVEMLQEVADTNVLANTKVLALNKQRAELIVGGRLGYFGGTTVSDGISQQTVEFLEVGTQLRFRPYIGDDDMVRLEIHPQRSNGIVDPVTGLPNEQTSEVTTNVMIRDGETVVIGGLIETRDVNNVKRVPVLGYLPGLSWLFKSEETSVERTEIIVMLTPRILNNGEMYREDMGDSGEEILDEAVRDKMVFREQFGPASRAVYAGRLLEDSRTALSAGHLDEARMLCDRSLVLDPLADGAVDLSVSIDEAIVERDLDSSSSSSGFIADDEVGVQ